MAEHEEAKKEARREYFPPKIVHTEKLTARATTCAKSDSTNCAGGPIQS